jgi:hypothetical protein
MTIVFYMKNVEGRKHGFPRAQVYTTNVTESMHRTKQRIRKPRKLKAAD